MPEKFKGRKVRFVAVEPEACPSLTRGQYLYDFGDTAATTPLVKMYTLGHNFIPAPIHAGGLRYHGDAPLLCLLYHHKYIEAVAYQQRTVFDAAVQFARTEGILPAPESAHAIRKAIDEALEAKKEGRARTILFGLSGHGHFDLGAYEAYMAGRLEDFAYPEDAIKDAMRELAAIQP
jgi:tryptophan synthase beta chain